MKSFKTFLAEMHNILFITNRLTETLDRNAGIDDWIEDFIKSDDPSFTGKTLQKRKEMAIAAYYRNKRTKK